MQLFWAINFKYKDVNVHICAHVRFVQTSVIMFWNRDVPELGKYGFFRSIPGFKLFQLNVQLGKYVDNKSPYAVPNDKSHC
jgi:hypothetical protein